MVALLHYKHNAISACQLNVYAESAAVAVSRTGFRLLPELCCHLWAAIFIASSLRYANITTPSHQTTLCFVLKMADESDNVDRTDGENPKNEKMFTLKKWNAVAMWSWDVECDTCAICRVQVMGKVVLFTLFRLCWMSRVPQL